MLYKRCVALLLAVLLLFSLCACSKGEGERFSVPISELPKSLDPQIADGSAANMILNNCFEGLVRVGAEGKIVPGVAHDWEISADGLLYTFYLRDNCDWHLTDRQKKIFDGDAPSSLRVTAHDFVFAFCRAISPETNAPDAPLLHIISNAAAVAAGTLSADKLGVTALSDTVLSISLKTADADFLYLLTKNICMPCNERFFEATKGKYGLDAAHLLCNGPLYLYRRNEGNLTCLNGGDRYHGNYNVTPRSVTFYLNDDPQSIYDKFTAETYDAAILTNAQANTISTKKHVLISSDNTTWALCFNCEEIKEKDLRVALLRAFDPTALSFNESSIFADAILPPCCTVGADPIASLAGSPAKLGTDPTAATELWQRGLQNIGRGSLSVTLLCTESYEVQMRALIQIWQQVFGLSINVQIELVTDADLQARMEQGDYQLAFAPLRAPSSLSYEMLKSFYSADPHNITRYADPSYDALVDEIRVSGSAKENAGNCVKAQNELLQNGVVCPLLYATEYLACAEGVSGVFSTAALDTVSYFCALKK